MKNKKILMSIFLLALALFIVPIISAAITTALEKPIAGGNYSTTMIVNCTTNIQESTNATLRWSETGNQTEWRAATSLIETGAISNTSEYYNAAFDISGLTDLSTYNFTCDVYNATDYYQTPTSVVAVTIDNINPNITVARGQRLVDFMGATTLTCSAVDGIDSNPTITRTIIKPDLNTVTITKSPYTATGSDTNILGEYTWNCSVTDDSGNTNESTYWTFLVDTDDAGTTSGDIIISREKEDGFPVIIIIIILVVLVVIIGTIIWLKGRK